jgi:hypothetical protein
MRIANGRGRRISGFGTRVFLELTGGRYVTIPRGALSRLLVEKITGSAEIILEDEIHTLRECEDCVEVELARTVCSRPMGFPSARLHDNH